MSNYRTRTFLLFLIGTVSATNVPRAAAGQDGGPSREETAKWSDPWDSHGSPVTHTTEGGIDPTPSRSPSRVPWTDPWVQDSETGRHQAVPPVAETKQPADDQRLDAALAAARSGHIDQARILARISMETKTYNATYDQVEKAIASAAVVPGLAVHPAAQSEQMTLTQFWDRWRGVLDGSRDLELETAAYARSISLEKLCDSSSANPFEKAECRSWEVEFKKAIKEGFRRRQVVADMVLSGTYDIPKARWEIRVNGTKDLYAKWFTRTPAVCPGEVRGMCDSVCRSGAEPSIAFSIPMQPEDARPIVDQFTDGLAAQMAIEPVGAGSRRISSCRTFPEGYKANWVIYKPRGMIVWKNDSGEILHADGVFAPRAGKSKKP